MLRCAVMDIVAYADTHVGRRSNNEDWYRIDLDLGLFIIADGMGGYDGGELASRLAAEAVEHYYREPPADAPARGTGCSMDEAFRRANEAVRRERSGRLARMGSTLSALSIHRRHVTIGHIGDSRIYRLRRGRLEQLTSDHSLVAALRAAGVSSEALRGRFGHVVTRAIGLADEVYPDVTYERVEEGDRFLLCTDGLTDVVDDEKIAEIFRELPSSEVATALVEEALRQGGSDNITAVVVEVRPQIEERSFHGTTGRREMLLPHQSDVVLGL